MGGTIWAESQVGKGSTFHFTIRAEQAPGLAPVDQQGPPLQLQGRRGLVVDDNATNRRILVRQVESWGMLGRDTASPAQALEWIRRGDPFDCGSRRGGLLSPGCFIRRRWSASWRPSETTVASSRRSSTFGATSLSELSRQLESLAGSGTLEGADELVDRIDAEYERVRIALERVREGSP